ncbi:MAG: RNA polymerase sigma factor [Flavobacteriales bacterium]|nr:RNA polymerase sigma factor [Flavobacteriales bacterium]MDW8431540.1 RNA polymerase sigma factor [Flavobacteriales bacterium]
MTERELVQKCVSGNSEAQKYLFTRYAGKLSAICRRYAADEDEARDFFQEGMIKIYTHLSGFKFQSSLETWMTRIMINTAITAIRRRKHIWESMDAHDGYLHNVVSSGSEESDDEMFDNNPSVYESLDPARVIEIFNELPPGYRAVLNMYVIEKMSHKEIAQVLGISENTSKTQLLKARKKIRELVQKHYSINL